MSFSATLPADQIDLSQFGGRKLTPVTAKSCTTLGAPELWNFGYVHPDDRSEDEEARDNEFKVSMPEFSIKGAWNDDPEKVCLWDCAKAANNGEHFIAFWQQTGSCFVAGQPVRLANGTEKTVEDLRIGDVVISHTGAKRKVVNVFRRHFTGLLRTFHTKGWQHPVTVTDDHDCLIVEPKEGCNWRYQPGNYAKRKARTVAVGERMLLPFAVPAAEDAVRSIDLASLVPGCDIIDDKLVRMKGKDGEVFVSNRHIPVDYRLGYLLGLYLADGSAKHNVLQYSLNHTTKRAAADQATVFVEELFGDAVNHYEESPKETVLALKIHHGPFAKFVKLLIPAIVYDKRVPAMMFGAHRGARLGLLRGWLDGDGHVKIRKIGKKNHGFAIRGVTSSHGLSRDMGRVALSLGMKPSVCFRKKAKHQRIAGTDVYLNGNDALEIYPEREAAVKAVIRPQVDKTMKTVDGWCVPITKIDTQRVENHPVYCVEVEVEHSLIVNDMAYFQCVGNGGGQAVWYTSAVEVIRLRDPEQVILPFYLLPYGRSRYYGGLRGRGEGSFGSAFAKAITTDGIVPYNVNGLPQPTISKENGVTWGSNAEYAWSDGAAIQQSWLDQSRKHLIRTTSQCRNADQMWEGISNWYAATIASDWGGQMRPAVKDGVLLNRRVTTWQHQMSVIARWRHPTLGKLFYILNSWGPRTHGICPSGAAPGGFWVTFAEMDYICRNGEAFLFSQFDGFPAQTFEFDF